MDETESWRERRSAAAQEQSAALARRQAAETEQARLLVSEFAQAATERGLRTSRLSARAYDGGGTYRTGQTGWYLRRNHSLAVGTEGEFYVLSVPASLRSRLFGTDVHPQDPPLVVGKGGRDGESIPMAELLALRLEVGDDWP